MSKSLASLLNRWRSDPTIAENIVAWRTLPAKEASLQPFPDNLHPDLITALRSNGIQALYSHQAAAWDIAAAGGNPTIVTASASGKSLCYNLPVLDRLLRHPQGRALYLFPIKALAQDQLAALNKLIPASGMPPISPGIYDGDTPTHARSAIRSRARLMITNPDMLHTGILPHHTNWAEFFRNLQFVIIDEMHIYRGVFGSHVANVIRRLKRIVRFYGAKPQFILTSATIGNPKELAERLVEEPITLVDHDGAERSEKHFLIYNLPLVNRELGIRRGLIPESVRLAEDLYTYEVQTIIFGRTRRSIELILTYLRQRTGTPASNAALYPTPPNAGRQESDKQISDVRGYRSGYLPGQRRQIESGLRQGEVRTVIATTALELGIDIGSLQAALLAGYPGNIASTWQQIGRSGRGHAAHGGAETSLGILVASSNPIDQFLARHPEYFFARSPEQALINPDNLLILLNHLRCAAFELTFRENDGFGRVPPEQLKEFLDFLLAEGTLHYSKRSDSVGRYFWTSDSYPAQSVSLRSASPDAIILQAGETGQVNVIGQVDLPSAAWMVHPGAVYLHEGQTYFVESLDLETHTAALKPVELDYYTESEQQTSVEILSQTAQSKVSGGIKGYGELSVTSQVLGFRKIRWQTNERIGFEPLDLPPSTLQTTAYWLTLAEETIEALNKEGLWNSAPNEYGPGWEALRQRVRARDGFCCQNCGAREQDRNHDVHHKIPFRAFASAEQANQLSNLVTLCQVCHRSAEAAVRVRSGLSGLAYVLSNLAPLFLMCDSRDLGVHADPQSPLAENRPIIVLYDQAPAGIGLSERLFELHAELVEHARELVSACECADGCPSCVGPGGENGYGGKREALALIEKLCSPV